MSEYHDIRFVDRVFTWDFEKANELLLKCLDRKLDRDVWLMFVHSNYDGTFDNYKKRVLSPSTENETKKEVLSDEVIKSETDRLIEKDKKLQKIIEMEDVKIKNRKLGKEVVVG